MAINTTGLLTGVLSPEQKAESLMTRGQANAALPAGMMGTILAPTRGAAITSGLGSLLGVDTRAPQERVAEAMTGLDPSQPEDQRKIIELLQSNGLEQEALAFTNAVQANNEQTAATRQAEQNIERQRRVAMTAVAQSNLPEPAKEYLRGGIRTGAITDFEGLYDRLGFDGAAISGADFENIDPDAYTPESLQAYAEAQARGEADFNLLVERDAEAAEGYEFYRNSEGVIVGQIPQRGTEAYIEARDATRADNNRAIQARRIGENVIDLVDDADKAIREGTASTGLLGTLLQQIPGTDTYNLGQDLETIKANLGFDRLQQMRDNSPTGGALGQVSELELQQLERSLRSLMVGQTKEQLRNNLAVVKQQYQDIIGKVRDDVTMEEYLGLEDPKPAGGFVVEEVN